MSYRIAGIRCRAGKTGICGNCCGIGTGIYNDHRFDSPEPVGWHQLYSGVGADIVVESITPVDPLVVFRP